MGIKMLNTRKMFGSLACIHFWKPTRIFYCLCILVATCAMSIVVILQLLIHANQTWIYQGESEFLGRQLRYDNSRQYAIQDSIFVGNEWSCLTTDCQSKHKVSVEGLCLATQASVEKFHHVIDSGTRWRGPVSIAVFTPGIDHQVSVIYLQYLTRCFESVMQNMSIHWVFPIEHPPAETSNISASSIESFDCSQRREALNHLLTMRPSTMMSWRQRLRYPQNLMRNVARKNCVSKYVLLTDVDIVPSPGMCEALSTFVATDTVRMCNCCVFVIPTYEIEKSSSLPVNKKELLDMVAAKLARTYRLYAHKPNQAATNVSAWEALPSNGGDFVSVGYQLPKFQFGYEPFYISKDSVPPHDERFVGYGYTRNTQVYEMQMAGYEFFVLDNVFLVHPGMAQHNMFNSPKRNAETRGSFKISRKFLAELRVKYARFGQNASVTGYSEINLQNGCSI